MTERRKSTRYKVKGLSTPFGEVIDVSDTGLGVFRKGRVICAIGDTVTIYLSHESKEIELAAKVVRIDNVGLFRHDIGFQFVDIDEGTRDELRAMTQQACNEFTGPRCYIAA